MILELEYNCTGKDLEELGALAEHQRFWGGPKWRSNLFRVLFVSVFAVLIFFRVETEIGSKGQAGIYASVGAIIISALFLKKMRRKAGGKVRMEISERSIVLKGDDSRSEILWSGFSKCLESENLFALLTDNKATLLAIPKRAFPDAESQEWFRARASQPSNSEQPAPDESLPPAHFDGANGVALTFKYKFRDHLSRQVTSWRVKGMVLVVLAILVGISIMSFVKPPPDAVEPPWKVVLFTAGILVPMMIVIFFLVFCFWWFIERKHHATHHLLLTQEGIEFTEQNASGRLPWSAYKYFCESRWTIFIWNPESSRWLMFPKRVFASPSDLNHCRTLVQTNLKPSRWFFHVKVHSKLSVRYPSSP